MSVSHCSTSRGRFLTLDLCYLKQQTQLPNAWSELWIFHLARQRESSATITAPLSTHSILTRLFTLPSGFSLEFTPQCPLLAPGGTAPVSWQSCHQTGASDTLRSAFPCYSVHCCLSLFKGDFLSSELSNLKNNELNSPSLFKESTLPAQSRGELLKFSEYWLRPALHWALGVTVFVFWATVSVSGPWFAPKHTHPPAASLWSCDFEIQSVFYV